MVQLGGRPVQLLQQHVLLSGIGRTLCFRAVWQLGVRCACWWRLAFPRRGSTARGTARRVAHERGRPLDGRPGLDVRLEDDRVQVGVGLLERLEPPPHAQHLLVLLHAVQAPLQRVEPRRDTLEGLGGVDVRRPLAQRRAGAAQIGQHPPRAELPDHAVDRDLLEADGRYDLTDAGRDHGQVEDRACATGGRSG
eukprot:scaffold53992_cov61-Phaeocystis_antarctica.AAC.2